MAYHGGLCPGGGGIRGRGFDPQPGRAVCGVLPVSDGCVRRQPGYCGLGGNDAVAEPGEKSGEFDNFLPRRSEPLRLGKYGLSMKKVLITAVKVTLAMTNVSAQIASIYGPYLWPSSDGPRFVIGFAASAAFSVLALLTAWVMRVLLVKENQKVKRELAKGSIVNMYGY